MQGNPKVIEALNAVYVQLKATEEQAHLQEHLLESQRYFKLGDWFHEIEECGHAKLIHPLMNRINALGARVAPGYQSNAVVFDAPQIDQAANAMLDRLKGIRAGYNAICAAAELADDYGTSDCVWKWIKWTEKRMAKFEARIGKIQTVGVTAFLAEMLD